MPHMSLAHKAFLFSAALTLIGCDSQSAETQILRFKAERRRADPPALWSISVVGEAPSGRPITICADSRITSGFGSITPSAGGQDCALIDQRITTANGVRYRCRLNGVVYAVSSGMTGDVARDFKVSSSAYPIFDEGPHYARTLQFLKIASACPAGWKLGEATDQHGVRRQAFDPASE